MRFQIAIKSFVGPLLDLFYPPVCANCYQLIDERSPVSLVCNSCLQLLRTVPPDVIRVTIQDKLDPYYLDNISAVYCFDDVFQAIVYHFKYQQMPGLAVEFARWIVRQRPDVRRLLDEAEVVIPVPLHRKRLRKRGYNQSYQICKGLGVTQKILPGLVMRVKNTKTQTRLGRKERILNIHEAFQISGASLVAGKKILLIDDVVTTGATFNECARVLKDNGAENVSALALATPVLENQNTHHRPTNSVQ
jgi:ComF family protein